MIDFLWLPFTYGFMQRGFAAAVIVGALCALVGCYVVLRSMAFMGDAMAHAILPGIAIAYLLGGNLQVGALIAAIAVALGIGFFSQGGEIKEDTAIGILFSAALSLGVALISSIRTYAVDLSHILFGNVLGVSPANLGLIGGLAAAVILTVVIFYRPFLVVTFDPVLAKTLRMPTSLLRNLMLVLLSVTIVISLQTVGIGLVAAMLVTPAAAAYMLTRRLPVMMGYSVLFGVLSGIIGLYLSYYLNIASGASIVMVATLIFLVAYFFSPRGRTLRGRLVRSRN
jgi:manganese/iron transport system permease protein